MLTMDHHFAALFNGLTAASVAATATGPVIGKTVRLPSSLNLTLTSEPAASPAALAISFGRRRPKLPPHLHIFGMIRSLFGDNILSLSLEIAFDLMMEVANICDFRAAAATASTFRFAAVVDSSHVTTATWFSRAGPCA